MGGVDGGGDDGGIYSDRDLRDYRAYHVGEVRGDGVECGDFGVFGVSSASAASDKGGDGGGAAGGGAGGCAREKLKALMFFGNVVIED